MKRPLAIHPLLIVLSTILFMVAHNVGQLALQDTWLPILYLLLPVALIQGVILLVPQSRRVALVAFLFFLLFVTYGQVRAVIGDL
ncbi:MAG: hypothetical protein ACRD2R_01900, partial [Terriglobales bacterium]